jgi:hypothetical protein
MYQHSKNGFVPVNEVYLGSSKNKLADLVLNSGTASTELKPSRFIVGFAIAFPISIALWVTIVGLIYLCL